MDSLRIRLIRLEGTGRQNILRGVICRILIVCIPLLLLFASGRSVAAPSPITVCVDPDCFPFERINERGEHEGIAADLMQLVSERSGVQFALVKTKDWDECL